MAETTHLICAHCGGDISISNAVPPAAVLTLYETSLAFNCPKCGAQYPLPVTVLTPNVEFSGASPEGEASISNEGFGVAAGQEKGS